MKRMKFLFGQRRMQVLLTLAVLLLAVSVVIGSGANFTSTSANPTNVFTAGNLSHINSKPGAALFTVTKMKPGDMAPGTVTITNDGDIAGDFTLSNSAVTNPVLPAVTAPLSVPFSDLLTVKIYSTTTTVPVVAKHQVYPAVGSALIGVDPALALGTFQPGESRTYDFEVTFPNGTPAHDNPYKKASMSLTYNWTSTS